jgi:D-psicose/D-tagatose/L-ribulose 3-epimerase
MKGLAFSQIAWELVQDKAVAKILKSHKVSGVELTPTKRWPDLSQFDVQDVLTYRKFWENKSLEIVALQALLFGKPELVIFQDEKARKNTLVYLKRVIDLASLLGAKSLVFGSPKNRAKGSLNQKEALEIAIPFFRELGDYAAKKQTCLCIEANAKAYGCDFIVNSKEAERLVLDVDSEGFGLHLDMGCMEMENESIETRMSEVFPMIQHFHVSSPHLAPVSSDRLLTAIQLTQKIEKSIRESQFWISVEMKSHDSQKENLFAIESCLT